MGVWAYRKNGVWTTYLAIGLLGNALGHLQLCEISAHLAFNVASRFSTYREQLAIVCKGPEESLALGPNLIPFLEHDDRNRVLIGANIFRQSIPILETSAPRVSSGFNSYVR